MSVEISRNRSGDVDTWLEVVLLFTWRLKKQFNDYSILDFVYIYYSSRMTGPLYCRTAVCIICIRHVVVKIGLPFNPNKYYRILCNLHTIVCRLHTIVMQARLHAACITPYCHSSVTSALLAIFGTFLTVFTFGTPVAFGTLMIGSVFSTLSIIPSEFWYIWCTLVH